MKTPVDSMTTSATFLLAHDLASFLAAAFVLAHDAASNFPLASRIELSSMLDEISIPAIGYATLISNPPLSLRATGCC